MQDDARPLDWSDWKVCEEPFTNSSCSLEGPVSSNFEGFIGSLDINDFPCASHPPSTSLLQDNASLDQCLCRQEFVCEAPAIFSSTSSDVQVGCCQFDKDTETICKATPVKHLVSLFVPPPPLIFTFVLFLVIWEEIVRTVIQIVMQLCISHSHF